MTSFAYSASPVKEIHEHKVVRVYTQRALAMALGMDVPEGATVAVTNATGEVSIVVKSEKRKVPLSG